MAVILPLPGHPTFGSRGHPNRLHGEAAQGTNALRGRTEWRVPGPARLGLPRQLGLA